MNDQNLHGLPLAHIFAALDDIPCPGCEAGAAQTPLMKAQERRNGTGGPTMTTAIDCQGAAWDIEGSEPWSWEGAE